MSGATMRFGHDCENCGMADETCYQQAGSGGIGPCCKRCNNTDTHGHAAANEKPPEIDTLRDEALGKLDMAMRMHQVQFDRANRMQAERDEALAKIARLREIMTPEQMELDGIGITWQSRAKRMSKRLALTRADLDAARAENAALSGALDDIENARLETMRQRDFARAENAALTARIAAVAVVANDMHDPLRGLSMSGGEVQDELRVILARTEPTP